MKEIFKIFVLLVMICTFTACAAGGKTSDTKDISIKLESFSDVKKDILSTDTEYENISVPTETLQALANDLPEKAELADLKQVNDREQCFGKIRPLFISDKDYKKEYYQGFDSSFPAGNVYDDTTYYLNVASNGGIGFLSKESAYDCETIKTVFVDRPYEDEEYVLGGQTYKLSQGVEYVDGFLQALTDSGFGNMKIAYVDVLKYDQENALLFHIQRTVDGIALNDFFYSDGDFDEYPYFGAKLYMTAPNTVGEFLGDHGFCELDGSAESVDKCVTLESALDLSLIHISGESVHIVIARGYANQSLTLRALIAVHIFGHKHRCVTLSAEEGLFIPEQVVVVGRPEVQQEVHMKAPCKTLVRLSPLGDHCGLGVFLVKKCPYVLPEGDVALLILIVFDK